MNRNCQKKKMENEEKNKKKLKIKCMRTYIFEHILSLICIKMTLDWAYRICNRTKCLVLTHDVIYTYKKAKVSSKDR